MFRVILLVLTYLISAAGWAQQDTVDVAKADDSSKFNIEVAVKNVSNNKGMVYFALYDSLKSFNAKQGMKYLGSSIADGKAHVTFKDLKPGTYAVICFHDANDNKQMDFESNGMPIEDYGVSNNVMNYGPPMFADAKFELKDKDLTFEIQF